MTKKQIAESAGVSRMYLYKLLNKKVVNPGIETLKRVAKAMNCSIKDLGYYEEEISNG